MRDHARRAIMHGERSCAASDHARHARRAKNSAKVDCAQVGGADKRGTLMQQERYTNRFLELSLWMPPLCGLIWYVYMRCFDVPSDWGSPWSWPGTFEVGIQALWWLGASLNSLHLFLMLLSVSGVQSCFIWPCWTKTLTLFLGHTKNTSVPVSCSLLIDCHHSKRLHIK